MNQKNLSLRLDPVGFGIILVGFCTSRKLLSGCKAFSIYDKRLDDVHDKVASDQCCHRQLYPNAHVPSKELLFQRHSFRLQGFGLVVVYPPYRPALKRIATGLVIHSSFLQWHYDQYVIVCIHVI